MSEPKQDWTNVCSWTGRPLNRLPKAGRAHRDDWAYICELLGVIGDPWCNPNSGGIANVATLAEIYGVGIQQFQRNILPTLTYVHWWGDIPVTNQSSAFANAALYRANVADTWRSNLGASSDISSGSLR